MKTERKIFSISELNQGVRKLLEQNFPLIWVEGEISNLSCPASGHIYFTLKDSQAQVSCAMFKGRNRLLKFKPENGIQVLIRTRVSLYEARGNYQLIAEHMEEAGDGALLRAFEELKIRLAKEGLFDEYLKQTIPELPQCIGVITSATGAAIRDVLSVLARRFPAIPVQLYPVPVQGDAAAPAIVNALQQAAKRDNCDVLLLVRGGGSLEDLWAFNEASVAYAIAACPLPIISGVGHEVDYTIADFVADHRAPTPSAAAELASPNQQTYLGNYNYYQQRMTQLIREKISQHHKQLSWLQLRLKQRHPASYLEQQSQRLDELQQRLFTRWQYIYREQQHRLAQLTHRLSTASPRYQIDTDTHRLNELRRNLKQAMQYFLNKKKQQLSALSRTLHAISPLQTLSRGYAIASDNNGATISHYSQVKVGDQLNIRLSEGCIQSTITRTSKKTPRQ
jgi:exodeoxyribonuclease VII large subunit